MRGSPTGRGRRGVRGLGVLAASAGALLTTLIAAPTAVAAPETAASTSQQATAGYPGSCPTAGTVTQGYHSDHDGVDIANNRGTPIYAVGPGEVTHSGPASGYGQWIRIRHPDGSVTEYGHMYKRLVSVGQTVSAGQRIALMGDEGQSSGPHLHFEVHRDGGFGFGDNPFTYLSEHGVSLPCTPGAGENAFPTWGSGVNIRKEATTSSAVVDSLPGPTSVTVECQVHGQLVNYDGYSNDAWSYLPDYGGYISNIFIDVSESWLPGIPTC